jgi:hypothetical protein
MTSRKCLDEVTEERGALRRQPRNVGEFKLPLS